VNTLSQLLGKQTWPEVEEYLKENDIIIFPTGSNEQHGPHLVEDTDTFVAYEVARMVAERTGVLVAPAMPYGNSIHHMPFPGTVTLGYRTLVNVYKEVIGCLHTHGFKKVVIFNGHGGNSAPINQALREIKEETGKTVYSVLAFASKRGFGASAMGIITQEGGGHACESETSQALWLGQRTRMAHAVKWKPVKKTELQEKYQGSVNWTSDWNERTETGSLGDPTIASAQKGEKMVNALVDDLVEFIEDLKNAD